MFVGLTLGAVGATELCKIVTGALDKVGVGIGEGEGTGVEAGEITEGEDELICSLLHCGSVKQTKS